MSADFQRPGVGIGVFVCNSSGKFLVAQRLVKNGKGKWSLPGGHLEHGETFEECAAREVLEETGLEIADLRFVTATNHILRDVGQHYVTIFMEGRVVDENAEPQSMEPEKNGPWEWVSWDELRLWTRLAAEDSTDGRPMFQPLVDLFLQRPSIEIVYAQ